MIEKMQSGSKKKHVLFAGPIGVGPNSVDEGSVRARTTTLDVQVDAVEDSGAERPRRAGAAEEEVPDGIAEGRSLVVGREARRASGTAE